MQITFLGTSAAVGWPAAYCDCAACEEIRRRGGRNIRSRSSIRIGPEHQIDCGPDIHAQLVRTGMSMSTVAHVLFSHSHADHISISELTAKHMSKSSAAKSVGVYANPETARRIVELIDALKADLPAAKRAVIDETFPVITIPFGEERSIGNLTVLPMRANHVVLGNDEDASNFLIATRDGRSMFYAVDTGWPTDGTWSMLRNRNIDTLIMDCTFGGMRDRTARPANHLDCLSFEAVTQEMLRIGALHPGSSVIATHIGPHQGLLHEELMERFEDASPRVEVAYDGMQVEI